QPPIKTAAAHAMIRLTRNKGPETFFIRFPPRQLFPNWIRSNSSYHRIPPRPNTSYHDIFFRRQGNPSRCSSCYRGDQFGDSLCPAVVNWCACEPSANIIQICLVPLRVDSNTICRPSGAHDGRSFRPASLVISIICCVATSITYKS